MITEISSREAFPVVIGSLVFFCEHFRSESSRTFTEQVTSDGNTVFTNSCKKALKIILDGRICNKLSPLSSLRYAEQIMSEKQLFNITYRDTFFPNCYVQSFSTDDKGEDFIYATISFITSSLPEEADI